MGERKEEPSRTRERVVYICASANANPMLSFRRRSIGSKLPTSSRVHFRGHEREPMLKQPKQGGPVSRTITRRLCRVNQSEIRDPTVGLANSSDPRSRTRFRVLPDATLIYQCGPRNLKFDYEQECACNSRIVQYVVHHDRETRMIQLEIDEWVANPLKP